MTIHFRLLKNQIKRSENFGRYYAHTVKNDTISLEQIERTIEQNCSAKASDVRLVLRELFDTVKQYLQDGNVVDLKEMGKFYISVRSKSVDSPEEFRIDKHITGFKCNYIPYGKRMKVHNGDKVGCINRSLTDGCRAVNDD